MISFYARTSPMSSPSAAPRIESLDELLAFRETTERISAFLNKRLRDHFSVLTPLLAPGRVLGKHVGARDAAPRADEALADLAGRYKQASAFPFDLKPDLDADVLGAVASTIQVHPYEYTYEARGAKTSKAISLTSPIRWVVTYGSGMSLAEMRAVLQSSGEHRGQSLRQAVVNALAFQVVLARNQAVSQILKDLRYEIEVRALPGLEQLPLAIFSLPLPSFRPADELLLTAVRLSGIPAFIELIDIAAARAMPDRLRDQIEGLVEG
jgi:hypothetical protein